ncbi:MAG: hypothetical protein EHM58_15295 [Ignavibacteriae bacterium]|nr:MAG: hypothetical protein EHM58_15295 [Ignavibacteriota bacterium]
MKKTYSFFLVLAFSLAVSCLISSCSGSKEKVEKQVTTLVPVSDVDKSITKNGITIDVQSIDQSNVGSYPELASKFFIMTKGFLESEPTPKEYSEANVLAGFSDPPAVTFMIKITNNTGHIVKLNGSDVGITIAGKDYRKLDLTKINAAWLNLFETNFTYQQAVPQELLSAIQNVSIWDENQKILPGKSITLYAPFDVKVGKGFGNATLSIYDVITNMDAAGNPTERTSMDFNFKESFFTTK